MVEALQGITGLQSGEDVKQTFNARDEAGMQACLETLSILLSHASQRSRDLMNTYASEAHVVLTEHASPPTGFEPADKRRLESPLSSVKRTFKVLETLRSNGINDSNAFRSAPRFRGAPPQEPMRFIDRAVASERQLIFT